MELHPTQKLVARSKATYRVVNCGRQWGKTTLSVLEMIAYAYAKKDREIAYFATTYDQARNIAWAMLKRYTEPIWAKSPNESRLELHVKTQDGGQSRITLRGWENIETARGQQFDFLVLDEVAQMKNFDYNWQAVLVPTLGVRYGKALFISTPYGYNHFFDIFKKGQEDKNWASWKFTSYDNPFYPTEQIEQAKADNTEEYFKQEYLAEFQSHVGLVYKEFDRLHHIKIINDFKPIYWIRGCDRGYRNPSAVPIIQVNQDDVWYQVDEVYQAGLTNPVLSELIKQKSGQTEFELSTMDSAQASDIKDLNDLGNFGFIPVKKESGESKLNYVQYKIQKFAERLKAKDGKSGYYVHPKCTQTISEFEKYHYPESKQDEAEKETPVKMYDHAMDALGDLNAMYLHYYEEIIKKPWADKIPGTYIPPAVEEIEQQTSFTEDRPDDYWDDDI